MLDFFVFYSKELKGSAVRCRRWIRPLQRTGVVSSAPALPPRRPKEVDGPAAGTTVDIPDGLRPFCRVERHGRVVALVHENQARLRICCCCIILDIL